MKSARIIAAALLLCAATVTDAAAQWNVAHVRAERNHAWATFGLEPALVTSVGYARLLRVVGHDFQVTAEGGVAAAELDVHDFRVRLGARTSLMQWRSLHLTGSAVFVTRGTENDIYRGLNFGADVTGAFGVYTDRWFVAGEFGKDKAIITHLTHTDWYRTRYYPEARDGWYLDAGGTYHYGGAAGLALGRVELLGRFGWQRTEDFNRLPVPVYGSLGVGFAF
jgi:hypothetical protein